MIITVDLFDILALSFGVIVVIFWIGVIFWGARK